MSIQANQFIYQKNLIRRINNSKISDNWTITEHDYITAYFNTDVIAVPYCMVEILINDVWINFEQFRNTLIEYLHDSCNLTEHLPSTLIGQRFLKQRKK